MFGFLGGAAGLVALALALLIWPFAPAWVDGYVLQYPTAALGVLTGFAAGAIGAEIYRRKIPGNLKGAATLLLIITGFGTMVGVGQTLLGPVGALLGLTVIVLGVAAFIFMEKTNPPTTPAE
ncbi:MAG: hypothetical protein K0R39_3702 [Symbiobacteriaceae bacterium]|jgi:peptidoglycan/LPS O-acetylase OafA/YrhL|nr:hypothetical protein [Symbiobacteriaceae bacterium]